MRRLGDETMNDGVTYEEPYMKTGMKQTKNERTTTNSQTEKAQVQKSCKPDIC